MQDRWQDLLRERRLWLTPRRRERLVRRLLVVSRYTWESKPLPSAPDTPDRR